MSGRPRYSRERNWSKRQIVIAGTLNPHLPKKTITATQMLEWLEEPGEADLA
jgi:hypothetical protein